MFTQCQEINFHSTPRLRWVVSFTFWPLCTSKRAQEALWVGRWKSPTVDLAASLLSRIEPRICIPLLVTLMRFLVLSISKLYSGRGSFPSVCPRILFSKLLTSFGWNFILLLRWELSSECEPILVLTDKIWPLIYTLSSNQNYHRVYKKNGFNKTFMQHTKCTFRWRSTNLPETFSASWTMHEVQSKTLLWFYLQIMCSGVSSAAEITCVQ
jgi:hypothetical protein